MITSRSNPKVQEIRLLNQAKHRHDRGEYFIEGVRLVEEALGRALAVKKVVYSPRLEKTRRGADLLSSLRRKFARADWLWVSDEVMGSMSDTRSHQGILAVVGKKEYGWEELEKGEGIILLLLGLQDPGNLGTIFRVAEAGGGAGIIISRGSADPYSPKVMRAAMGSLFRLPFLANQDPHECLKTLRSKGYRVWATAASGGTPFWQADLGARTVVMFGREGSGIPGDLMAEAGGLLTIPMSPATESLNAAMAAGLVVYEALRQERAKGIPICP